MFALVVVAWHPYHTTLVENGTDSRHLPPEFFSAVRDGITEELAEQPVRAVLVDGVFHEVDSNYQSFRTAAKHATRLALGRLPLSLPADERSAEEITEAWRVDRESRSAALIEHLTGELAHFGFALENEVWWRAKAALENGFGNRKQRRFSNLVLEKLGVEIDSAGSEQNSNEERQTDHHR